MKEKGKRRFAVALGLILAFVLFTVLLTHIDVQPVGQNGTDIGFAALNTRFHRLTGTHMGLYTLTDWLGLVPVGICLGFGALGLVQWIGRRSLRRVDADLMLLGAYYILVILCYLIFERIPINYRPVPIDGFMEASYPSSTVLLVLSVMPTLPEQVGRRTRSAAVRRTAAAFALVFSLFMTGGRLISGVHWLTDIAGGILLGAGLAETYRAAVLYLLNRGGGNDGKND